MWIHRANSKLVLAVSRDVVSLMEFDCAKFRSNYDILIVCAPSTISGRKLRSTHFRMEKVGYTCKTNWHLLYYLLILPV